MSNLPIMLKKLYWQVSRNRTITVFTVIIPIIFFALLCLLRNSVELETVEGRRNLDCKPTQPFYSDDRYQCCLNSPRCDI